MNDLFQSPFFAVACVAVLLNLVFWLLALIRKLRGQPLIVWVPRRPVPWTVLDLLQLALAGLLIVTATGALLAWSCGVPPERMELSDPDLTANQRVGLVVTFSLASVLTWLLCLLWLRLFAGASRADLGWPAAHRLKDLRLGLVAFIMLVVPMLSIHYLTQRVFPSNQTHPFVEVIFENPRPLYLVPIVVAAVLIAPVVEEFACRVMLQGWLERLCFNWPRRQNVSSAEAPGGPPLTASPTAVGDSEPPDTHLGDAQPHPPRCPEEPRDLDADAPAGALARWLPIMISGMVFALGHAGQGPAPIPLLFLGLGLGYLYQRTHRILPCIVVHFLVNCTAAAQLALYVAQRGGAE